MDLAPHVTRLRSQITEVLAPPVSAPVAGMDGDAQVGTGATGRSGPELPASLDAALWLSLLEVLSEAAEELSSQLGPGAVEVRLRGRSPQLVVAPPGLVGPADVDPTRPGPSPGDDGAAGSGARPPAGGSGSEGDDGGDGAVARVNLRLPEGLKRQAEAAARRNRTSLNSWLVTVVAEALAVGGRSAGTRGRRYSGWVR